MSSLLPPTVETRRDRGRVASAWIASVVGHLVALGLGGLLLAGSLAKRRVELVPPPAPPPALADRDEVDIDLPVMVGGGAAPTAAPVDPAVADVPRGGGEGTPRPDMGRAGRGGTDNADTPAVNMADRDDGLLLSPDVMSRVDRSQVQRVRSANDRASREDRRSSRDPMELTFIASGRHGKRPERRAPSDNDPSRGARESGAPHKAGGVLGANVLPPGIGEAKRDPGGVMEGALKPSLGAGVRDGAFGKDARDSAKAAFARPMVQEGAPSVPAGIRGKVRDNTDSEQEDAVRLQSLLHASGMGGTPGVGPGGQRGPGAPGAGGNPGAGANAHVLGTGQGPGVDVDPRDKRRMEYLRKVMGKIGPHWANAFPKWAIAEGKQGTVIVSFTILADGSVASVGVTRPSGVPEFDDNCKRAVLKAAPFEPLPAELGVKSFRWAMPFEVKNPVVRPRDVKDKIEP